MVRAGLVWGVVIACGALSGCGAALRVPIRARPEPISEADRAERLRLGSAAATPGAPGASEIDRLQRLALLAERLDQPGTAIDAAIAAVRLARGLSVASPGDPTMRQARIEAEALAVGVAERLGNALVVVQLAEGNLEPVSEGVVGDALARHADGPRLAPALWARLGAEARAHAELNQRRPIGTPALSANELRAAGPAAAWSLERLLREATILDDRARLLDAARALADVDPVGPSTLALAALIDELDRGVITDQQVLFAASGEETSLAHGSAVARLMAARETSPASEAVPAALALALLRTGATYDAQALARSLSPRRSGTALLVRTIDAFAEAERGDAQALRALAESEPRVLSSAGWVARLRQLADQDDFADPVTQLLSRARRTFAPTLDEDTYFVAIDDGASEGLRRAAIEHLATHQPVNARIVAGCLYEHLTAAACEDRMDAMDEVFAGPGDAAVFGRLGPAVRGGVLLEPEDPLEEAVLASAAAWLDEKRDTTEAFDEPWLEARLMVAAQGHDPDTLRSLLDERGALLRPAVHAGARIALAMLEAGEDPGGVWAITLPTVAPLGTLLEAPGEEPAWFGTVCARVSSTSPECRAFMARLESAAPDLAAAARAAYGLGDRQPVDLAALEAAAGASTSAGAVMVQAFRAEERGDHALASERWRSLLLSSPSTPEVWRRYLYHALEAGTPATTATAVLAAATPTAANGRDLTTIVEGLPGVDGPMLERLFTYDPTAYVALGAAATQNRAFVAGARSLLVEPFRTAPDAITLRFRAGALLPLVGLLDEVTDLRVLRVEVALLAGQPAEGLRAADRPARDIDDSLPFPEVSDMRDLLAAAPLLGPELVGHVVLGRPSARTRTAESLANFLAPLEAAAARDPRLTPFLCGEYVRAADANRAMATCGPLYAAHPTPEAAYRVAYALTMGAAPTAGIDADAFFARARASTTGATLAGIAWNDALRLAAADRHRESAEAALQALAAGHDPGGVGTWETEQAEERGAEIRSRARGAPQNLVYLSLASGEAEMADRYAEAARRRFAREPAEAVREDDDYRSVCLAGDLAAWAAEDGRAGRIDRDGLVIWDRLRREGFRAGAELDVLAAEHPEALVVALALAVRHSDEGRHREAYDAIRPLLDASPRATLAVVFRRSIGLAASRAEADETVARLRTMFPNDPRLVEVDAAAAMPPELGTPEALAAFLAELDESELARLAPRLRIDPQGHALAAFPGNGVPLDSTFGVQAGPVRLLVTAEPRLAHCEGEACLDGMLSSFDAMGMTPLWHAAVDTMAGPGARALIAGPGGAGLFTAVPRGSIVFLIGVFGAPEAIAGRLRSYALLERTFIPLDVVVPSGWAAPLAETGAPPRTATASSPEAELAEETAMLAAHIGSIRAWAGASIDGAGCPIQAHLDATHPLPAGAIARTEAVLRLFLGTAEPARRRALLRCVDARLAGASALGLAAALDPSADVHATGISLVRADPAPARALAERLLELDPGRPLGGVAHRDSDLPPFAAVELVLALPEVERRAVTAALWARSTPDARAIAVIAEQMQEGSLDHALVRDVLRSGSADAAMTAADVLYGSVDQDDLAAARARLDGLVAPLDESTRRLTVRLVWELARRLDGADAPRFERVAARLRESAARLRDEEQRLFEWTAERVEHELAVLRAAGARTAEARRAETDEEVEADLEVYRGMRRLTERPRTSARVAEMLATESLARVLPGTHWSYVRVPSPSLLITTLEAMYDRLESGSASDGALARTILTSMLERSNAALLGPDGGLDLSRPVECATADRFPRAWVCAVYVSDRDRVEDILVERRYGTNSGAWLAVEAARQARSLPIAAGGMPYELAGMLEEAPPTAPPRISPVVVRERARTEVDLDGVRVLRYGTFVARENDDTSVDTEHYLFTGDRLVMFGLEETARAILAEPLPAARTLAGQPRFRALTDGWTNGSVLQLVNVGFRSRMLPAPLPDGDMGLELSAWDEGLVARIRMPFAEASPSVSDLVARLPEGMLSSMAFVPDDDETPPEARTEPPEPLGWRGYLLSRSTRFALGWYGASDDRDLALPDRVWGSWAIALSPTEALITELRAWSLWPEPGRTTNRDGLFFGLDRGAAGDTLVVATNESLLRGALTPPNPGDASGTVVGSGRLDGIHTAEVARTLASGLRRDDERRSGVELVAAILGIGRDVSFEARADERRRELVLTARVTPNLGPPGDSHAIIDELLRHARNAVVLPRALTATELRGTVRLVVTTSEPEVVATRGFGGSPRVTAEVRDASTLVLTVSPSDATPSPINDVERAQLLASTSSIRADAESIVRQALALAPAGTPPAEAARAIVTWVHDHIRYELTAEELDAATVLERGRGDCTELARITTALLRAAGIPAETREGFLVVGAEMGAHAWVAYHDGTTFREIDPTGGRADVDASYLPSSVLTVMGLAAIGDLRITEAEAR